MIYLAGTKINKFPIKDGKECAIGKSDFDRSATGELVYTGTLRTSLASFLDKVELNGKTYRVASELFVIVIEAPEAVVDVKYRRSIEDRKSVV